MLQWPNSLIPPFRGVGQKYPLRASGSERLPGCAAPEAGGAAGERTYPDHHELTLCLRAYPLIISYTLPLHTTLTHYPYTLPPRAITSLAGTYHLHSTLYGFPIGNPHTHGVGAITCFFPPACPAHRDLKRRSTVRNKRRARIGASGHCFRHQGFHQAARGLNAEGSQPLGPDVLKWTSMSRPRFRQNKSD